MQFASHASVSIHVAKLVVDADADLSYTMSDFNFVWITLECIRTHSDALSDVNSSRST